MIKLLNKKAQECSSLFLVEKKVFTFSCSSRTLFAHLLSFDNFSFRINLEEYDLLVNQIKRSYINIPEFIKILLLEHLIETIHITDEYNLDINTCYIFYDENDLIQHLDFAESLYNSEISFMYYIDHCIHLKYDNLFKLFSKYDLTNTVEKYNQFKEINFVRFSDNLKFSWGELIPNHPVELVEDFNPLDIFAEDIIFKEDQKVEIYVVDTNILEDMENEMFTITINDKDKLQYLPKADDFVANFNNPTSESTLTEEFRKRIDNLRHMIYKRRKNLLLSRYELSADKKSVSLIGDSLINVNEILKETERSRDHYVFELTLLTNIMMSDSQEISAEMIFKFDSLRSAIYQLDTLLLDLRSKIVSFSF